ncbi:hypothetical protein FRC03_011167 [Tulasnella sp. 419]|nr:hypothetical protein FRC03_011167 [Tulasnella sp. 419]
MDSDDELQRVLELSRLEEEERLHRGKQGKAKDKEVIEILDSDDEQFGVNSHPVINVDDDDDPNFQEQLALAIQASKIQGNKQHCTSENRSSTSYSSTRTSNDTFLSERAKMEQERLARLKRLRPNLVLEQEGRNDDPPTKRQKSTTLSEDRIPTGNLLWDGEIRQTANIHASPLRDASAVFRLTEILGDKSDIQFIIFSSYCVDIDWLRRIFPTSCPVVYVAQPETQDGLPSVKDMPLLWVKTMPRLRGGRGCMHMKFMLVFMRSGRLRVMITTANFVSYDWKDIENTAWVQDIPRRTTTCSSTNDQEPAQFSGSFFAEQLQGVLKALNVSPALRSVLSQSPHAASNNDCPLQTLDDLSSLWDWSRVKVRLVISLAGRWEGWKSIEQFGGHGSLSKAIREIGAVCPSDKELVLECQGSSIGTYSASWLNEFYVAAKRGSSTQWLDSKRAGARSQQLAAPANIKILFPSLRTVQASVLGEPGGGTMFCRAKQWNGKNFPRHLFHDSNSKRGGILMHTKMILATFADKTANSSYNLLSSGEKDSYKAGSANHDSHSPVTKGWQNGANGNRVGGWCYIGSHNFTPSAWGNLSGTSSDPVMNVTNYELGIMFALSPVETDVAACKVATWERPPRKYLLGKDVPWMQDEHL